MNCYSLIQGFLRLQDFGLQKFELQNFGLIFIKVCLISIGILNNYAFEMLQRVHFLYKINQIMKKSSKILFNILIQHNKIGISLSINKNLLIKPKISSNNLLQYKIDFLFSKQKQVQQRHQQYIRNSQAKAAQQIQQQNSKIQQNVEAKINSSNLEKINSILNQILALQNKIKSLKGQKSLSHLPKVQIQQSIQILSSRLNKILSTIEQIKLKQEKKLYLRETPKQILKNEGYDKEISDVKQKKQKQEYNISVFVSNISTQTKIVEMQNLLSQMKIKYNNLRLFQKKDQNIKFGILELKDNQAFTNLVIQGIQLKGYKATFSLHQKPKFEIQAYRANIKNKINEIIAQSSSRYRVNQQLNIYIRNIPSCVTRSDIKISLQEMGMRFKELKYIQRGERLHVWTAELNDLYSYRFLLRNGVVTKNCRLTIEKSYYSQQNIQEKRNQNFLNSTKNSKLIKNSYDQSQKLNKQNQNPQDYLELDSFRKKI